MRKILGLVLVLALGFGWLALDVAAESDGSVGLEQTYSGSVWPTEIDVDGDPGRRAIIWQGCGHGPYGNFSYTAMSEAVVDPIETGKCPQGWVEDGYSAPFSFTQRNVMGGDLIYFEQDPNGDGFSCSDPATGESYGVVDTLIVGGTGWVDGATGYATFKHTGVRRLANSSGRPVFVATSGTISGRIYPVRERN